MSGQLVQNWKVVVPFLITIIDLLISSQMEAEQAGMYLDIPMGTLCIIEEKCRNDPQQCP